MNNNLLFSCCEINNNDIWLSEIRYNGIYKINMNDFIAEKVGTIKGKKTYQSWIHKASCRYNNYIYFFYTSGGGYTKINTDNNEIEEVHIDNFCVTDIIMLDYSHGLLIQKFKGQNLLLMNFDNDKIEMFYNWQNFINNYINDDNDELFEKAVILNDCIFLPILFTKYVIQININTKKICIKNIGNYSLLSIGTFNNKLVLMSVIGQAIFLDEQLEIENVIELKNNTNSIYSYISLIDCDDTLLILPCDASQMIYRIDSNYAVEIICVPNNFFFLDISEHSNFKCNFLGYKKNFNKIYISPCASNMFLIYDIKSHEITGQEVYKPFNDDLEKKAFYKKVYDYQLDKLIDLVEKLDNSLDIYPDGNSNAGRITIGKMIVNRMK